MSLILPSYQSGYAPRDYEPAYPSLWQGCVAAYAPLLGPTGLVLRDAVGKNDGVLTNGPTWDISGGRYALGFDGSNDLIDCGSRLGSDLLNNYSIFVWARPTGSFVNYRNILSRSNGSTAQHGIIVFSTGIWYTQTADNQVTVGGQLTLDNWFHVGYTFQNGVMTTYQNGVAVNTRSGATNGFVSANFKIGNDDLVASGTQPRPFLGQIDDVRVYSRVLTPKEIALLSSRRGIGYDYKSHRSYSKTQSSGLLKRLILTGQT